jgi:phosphatidylinositol glycan class B
VHPWGFAVVYRIADAFAMVRGMGRVERAEVLVLAPKVAQAFCAALGDFYTWKLGRRIYGAGSKGAMAAVSLL